MVDAPRAASMPKVRFERTTLGPPAHECTGGYVWRAASWISERCNETTGCAPPAKGQGCTRQSATRVDAPPEWSVSLAAESQVRISSRTSPIFASSSTFKEFGVRGIALERSAYWSLVLFPRSGEGLGRCFLSERAMPDSHSVQSAPVSTQTAVARRIVGRHASPRITGEFSSVCEISHDLARDRRTTGVTSAGFPKAASSD